MNDKERLEEIKKHRNDADSSTDEYEFEKINFYNLHVDWLIEQAERAERVQELEEDLTKYRNSFEFQLLINNSIKKQNKRYREALEFYAGGKHVAYKLDETDDDLVVDYGETARKALEGEE